MNKKYLAYLFGSSAVFALLSVVVLLLFVRHEHFRQTAGHDKPAWDKFAAKVEGGKFKPETMMRFTNSWFLAQQQDHMIIQAEETVSDRVAGPLVFIGSFGLLTVLFQTWVIFCLKHELRKP